MATRLLHALLLSAGLAAGAACAGEARRDLDLPAGPLAASVEALARQTGLPILYDAHLLEGRQGPALRGRLTARQALDALLAGSGLAAIATGGGFALQAAAQPIAGERQLGEIVAAATRTANPIDRVPASLAVATREDFEEVQAGDVARVMAKLPGVEFGGGPRMNGEIPAIRGYSGKAVTLLVDGARQNWLNNTLRNPLQVDPYFIGGVEVLRGSASSLYGPGGLGGAMVFNTIAAGDFLAPDQAVGGGVRLGHASADRSDQVHARVYAQSGAFDGLVAFGRRDWGSTIRQGGGTELDPNDGASTAGLVKLGATGGGLRYELAHQEFRRDNRENSNPQADASLPGAAAVQVFHTRQEQTVLKARTAEGAGGPGLVATVYQADLDVTADAGANPALAPYTRMRTRTVGAGVQGSLDLAGGPVRQRATAGVDWYRDRQTSLSGAVANPVIPDGEQDVAGVFVQDEIVLGAWTLIPSLRHDRYETSPHAAGAPRSANRTSPKLAVAWQASPAWMIYGSYGEAFRAPNVNEMYWSFTGTFGYSNFRANPDLKPETDTTVEIGTKYSRRGVFAGGDRAKLRASLFDSRARDMITSVVVGAYTRTSPIGGTGLVFQYQNVAEARRRGGEVEATYGIAGLHAQAGYSRVRVTDEANGGGLFSPPDKLALQVRYAIPGASVDVSWHTTGVAAQDYDATPSRRRPGYAVHDVFATWNTAPGGRKLRLDVGVTNLSDKRHLVYQSSNTSAFTYQEGRSLKVALSAEF